MVDLAFKRYRSSFTPLVKTLYSLFEYHDFFLVTDKAVGIGLLSGPNAANGSSSNHGKGL